MGKGCRGGRPLAPDLDPGFNKRLIYPGSDAQLDDLPVPRGVDLVLAIAQGQARALSQQSSPPGSDVRQLGDRRSFLFGCQPPAVSGPCRRSLGRCDEKVIGSKAAHGIRVEYVFDTCKIRS
jgi:hypothetical protein